MLSACEMQGKIEKEGFDWIYPWFDEQLGVDEERNQHARNVLRLIDVLWEDNLTRKAWSIAPHLLLQLKLAAILHDAVKEVGVPDNIRLSQLDREQINYWYGAHGEDMVTWLEEYVPGFSATFPLAAFLIADHNGHPNIRENGHARKWEDNEYVEALYLFVLADSATAAHERKRPLREEDRKLTMTQKIAKGWHFIHEIVDYVPPVLEEPGYLAFVVQAASDITGKGWEEPVGGVEVKT
jgi:hypothetical protein